MVELTEEDVSEMALEFEEIASATTILAADVKETRVNLAATTPRDADSFMLMLKRYNDLLLALFYNVCPLYLQIYEIVQAFRDYAPNARSKITHQAKTCILCIILLQSRRFAQGKMHGGNTCLDEFTHMAKPIKAKTTR